jgi:ParB family chromosome partitioning protein
LGRGLKALIPVPEAAEPSGELVRIAIGRVRRSPFQPRKTFDPGQLAELESSLAANGLLQPIAVRKVGEFFELIAGERRLRAATNLGWTEIPALIKTLDDRSSLVLALVENLQRTDLNPVEEAQGYLRLADEFGLTHQQIADATSKDRATITNLLRILSLPDRILELLSEGRLSAGHAKVLASLTGDAALALANEIVAESLSVRATEDRAKRPDVARTKTGTSRSNKAAPAEPVVRELEDALRRRLQTDVHVNSGTAGRGELKIAFYSKDDLQRIIEIILPSFRDI